MTAKEQHKMVCLIRWAIGKLAEENSLIEIRGFEIAFLATKAFYEMCKDGTLITEDSCCFELPSDKIKIQDLLKI